MQLTNTPGKLVLPFANAGAKNTIPTASQIGITAGAASLVDGFPPLTRTPIAAGGVPPSGLDMNGILYELSAILRWANAGGGYAYDAAFATDSNVGGYPKGARVLRSDGAGYWLNTIDGNTVDPESVTVNAAQVAGWVPDLTNGIAAITMTSANVTLTPAQYGKPFVVLSGVLTANLNLIFPNLAGEWTVVNNCTGAFTVTAKTAAGTGVPVPSGGKTRIVWGDNANIYSALNAGDTAAQFDNSTSFATTAFLKRFGKQYSDVTPFSGALTGTVAHVGAAVYGYGGTSNSYSFPDTVANNIPTGGVVTIWNFGTIPLTIVRQGTNQIQTPNSGHLTSFVLPVSTCVEATHVGGGIWQLNGTGVLSASIEFSNSLAASGYQKFPNGLIVQWGTLPPIAAGAASTAQSFPIAFPNNVYGITATPVGAAQGIIETISLGLSSVTWGEGGGVAGHPISGGFYLAWGR